MGIEKTLRVHMRRLVSTFTEHASWLLSEKLTSCRCLCQRLMCLEVTLLFSRHSEGQFLTQQVLHIDVPVIDVWVTTDVLGNFSS